MTSSGQAIHSEDPRSKSWDTNGGATPVDLFARISRIEQAHTHPRDRGDALLGALCESLGAIAGTVTFAVGSEEYELQTQDGPAGVSSWMPSLRSAALEARSHSHTIARVFGSKTDAPEFVVIAAPFDLAGRDPFGAASILCRCRDASQAERLQLHLRSASILASSMLARSRSKRPAVEMDDFARVLSRAGAYRNIDEFAYAMTNAAKQRFNCEQCALGIVGREKLRVACISGLDHVKHRSPGVHHIEQAMGECADAREPLVEQTRDRWEGGDVAAEGMLHKRWRATCAGASVASVPVFSGEELVAVLSLRRTPDEPFDADEIAAVQKLLTPLGSAIPLISNATRSLPSHAVSSVRQSAAWLVRPASITKKLLIVGAVAGTVWYAFMPSMYRVTTPGTVVAEREYVIAATIGSRVSEVLVRDGERVKAGQPLAKMDTSRLRIEEEGLLSEIVSAEVRIKDAVAKDDPATASVARAEKVVHLSRLRDVRARIEEATIDAPRAGIVTGKALSNLQGRLVPEGEPLLTIADEGSLTIELRIPQSRVTDLSSGAPLRFASHARPENPSESELAHIAPSGVEREGRTVFLGKSPIEGGEEWLRPGMEGVAIVDGGMHPNWWIALHRVIDTARLNFWID